MKKINRENLLIIKLILINIKLFLASDSSGELHVLGHDGNSLGVDGAEVGVFEETDEVALGGFLKSEDSGGLESQVSFEFLSDFSD